MNPGHHPAPSEVFRARPLEDSVQQWLSHVQTAADLFSDEDRKDRDYQRRAPRRFGAHIARRVESVSDDPSRGAYTSRKRELLDRVAHADPGTRAVFAADKISKVRELALLPARRLGETKVRAELAHYRASLEMLRRGDGDVSLVDRLDAELNQLLLIAPVLPRPNHAGDHQSPG